MKQLFFTIALAFLATVSFAQKPVMGCVDRDIRLQSEELRSAFLKQGLSVLRDAMIGMQSNEPTPIAVNFTKGKLYQMVYIANRASSKMELEIFDGNDKKIGSKSAGGTGEPNYIIYSFIPDKTDIYLVVLSQKFKGKETCGSFTILAETPPAEAPVKAENPSNKNTPTPPKKK